jgi:hypothetical protein
VTARLSWQGAWIAPTAQAWLQTSRQARILHLFTHTCNLINERGQLLTLAQAEVGPGPFSLTLAPGPVSDRWSELSDDSLVVVTPNRLYLGSFQVDCASARLWSPQPDWAGVQLTSAAWGGHYGPLWQQILAGWPSELGIMGEAERPFRRYLQELVQALFRRDMPTAATAARHLAGLGPGLTPAGDDALLGIFYGLWATHPATDVPPLTELLAETAAPQTTTLSAAWLRAAARGEAAAVWHDLVRALKEERETAVVQASRRIIQTGHTSGHNALTGFVAIIEMS